MVNMDLKKYRSKLIGSTEERAVSPVIGVILMVAITVILAAVIAAFVLNMGPGGEAVQASGDGTSEVTLSITDGGNADEIVVVDDTGTVKWENDANTGSEYTISDGDQSIGLGGSSKDYSVYAISGDLATGDTLDDAEGQVEIDSFTLSP